MSDKVVHLMERRPLPGLLDGRGVERAVDLAIEHQVSIRENQVGPDDPYVQYMRATRRSAEVLPFPTTESPIE